jgi:hypothetical protein
MPTPKDSLFISPNPSNAEEIETIKRFKRFALEVKLQYGDKNRVKALKRLMDMAHVARWS